MSFFQTLPKYLREKNYTSFQGGKWWEYNYQNGGFTEGMSTGWSKEDRGKKDFFYKLMGNEGLKLGRVTNQPVYDFVDKQKDGRNWPVNIMAFTGMRNAEVMQLRKEDIKQSEEGIWYFRVTEEAGKLKTQQKHLPNINQGTDAIAINELFLDSEIEDAQLRMIFTACHPKLESRDRISFALKTVSGFSIKEISSALLTKEDTIKKRLLRARKTIQKSKLKFEIPQGKSLPERLESVMEVLYLIFNEGFHSNKKEKLIRKELCSEAIRLTKILLKNTHTRAPEVYALCALMCFHSARIETKTNAENEVLDLKNQDRSKWYFPLIQLGNNMMHKAVENTEFSCYHYEAAIAAEHLKAKRFEDTNWDKILYFYQCLNTLKPMQTNLLTMAVVSIQKEDYRMAKQYLKQLKPEYFEHYVEALKKSSPESYVFTRDDEVIEIWLQPSGEKLAEQQSKALDWLDDHRYMLKEYPPEVGHTRPYTAFGEQEPSYVTEQN